MPAAVWAKVSTPSSQVAVSLPLSPAAGWIEDHRARLEKARQMHAG